MALRAIAEVDLGAIERNVARLTAGLVAPARMCAVVKADGYGHGAVPVACAALRGGATVLAVAAVEEAAELRRAGIDAPLLILGAISPEELPVALAARAELVAWAPEFVAAVRAAAAAAGGATGPVGVHVKLDTGLGRLGTRDLAEAIGVAEAVHDAAPVLELAGAMTHFATSDEDDLAFLDAQLRAFTPFVERIRAIAPRAVVHAANSGATLRVPASHFDMVRCGIAIYGCDPMHADPAAHGLEPALTLASYVAAVKPVAPGESAGYSRRFVADREGWLATLPIGYGDGVSRRLTNNCDVLIGGLRVPLVGTVSMDNITVDLGPEPFAAVGDRAVLIGADGSERQTAEQLARRIGTINYEVVCGISRRVPRTYVGASE